MIHKGELSFVMLWVINPIVILFYQNCSMVPSLSAHARNNQASPPALVNLKNSAAQAAGEREPACVSRDCLKFE